MPRILALCTLLLLGATSLADDPTRLFPDGKKPTDKRLSTVRSLNDKDFFLRPPGKLGDWQVRRQLVREQILVSTGLWPLPSSREKITATIHGRIDREGYSVEKVFFASMKGHYVCGNLYRPRTKEGKLPEGTLPGVLCPHGHWANGRFYDAGEKAAKAQIDKKAEKTLEGGRYPLQARCAQLARMGCVVFFYDMVGYADSKDVGHGAFNDVEAELRLQNLMGLQTWNSIRALDFLTSLPEVDGKRIGVTGASGGGTQTFILCGIDERPAVAFPAVMVSTQMQGGCVCENAPYLRIGTGNVEFAALFAPKPMAMSGANDWTIDIEKKGLPELKLIYRLYGKSELVDAKCWPKFDHNYNQPAREYAYDWFNKYLDLKQRSPVEEAKFEPIAPAKLSVFDNQHPRPKDALDVEKLRAQMTQESNERLAALKPKDAKSLAEYRRVVGTALRVMITSSLPEAREVESKAQGENKDGDVSWRGHVIGRRGQGEQVPVLVLRPKKFNGTAIVWIDPDGKSSLMKGDKFVAQAQALLDAGCAIVAPDTFGTGELSLEKPMAVSEKMAGYTFGYNRPLLSQRVHDVLTAVGFARKQEGVKSVNLLGRGKAGPWVLLARGLCGDAVARTAADADRFRFDEVRKMTDEMMLPGAIKYGGMPALSALAAPNELLIHNHSGTGSGKWLKTVYEAAGAEKKLESSGDRMEEGKVVKWLVR